MKQIRQRLTYANVMSSLAVFMVLGGGAAIAANLPKKSVGTPQLKANAVKTGKIGKNAVKTGKLGPAAVKTGKIANGAVLTTKLGDLAVTSGKLANESVLTDKIAPDAVTVGKLANNAVTTDKIAGEAVITGKLANDSVVAAKLASGAVTAPKFGTATFTLGPTVNAPVGASFSTFDCPAGRRMLSGGLLNSNTDEDLVLIGSHPNNPNQWRVQVFNSSAGTIPYRIVMHCLLP